MGFDALSNSYRPNAVHKTFAAHAAPGERVTVAASHHWDTNRETPYLRCSLRISISPDLRSRLGWRSYDWVKPYYGVDEDKGKLRFERSGERALMVHEWKNGGAWLLFRAPPNISFDQSIHAKPAGFSVPEFGVLEVVVPF